MSAHSAVTGQGVAVVLVSLAPHTGAAHNPVTPAWRPTMRGDHRLKGYPAHPEESIATGIVADACGDLRAQERVAAAQVPHIRRRDGEVVSG